jgi:hydroxymethylbilane synthase
VVAERAFLAAMGGGCQSPVAALAEVKGSQIYMRALSFTSGPLQRAEGKGPLDKPEEIGSGLARELKPEVESVVGSTSRGEA